jgi:hypothetical protein
MLDCDYICQKHETLSLIGLVVLLWVHRLWTLHVVVVNEEVSIKNVNERLNNQTSDTTASEKQKNYYLLSLLQNNFKIRIHVM